MLQTRREIKDLHSDALRKKVNMLLSELYYYVMRNYLPGPGWESHPGEVETRSVIKKDNQYSAIPSSIMDCFS